nr:outer membrane lipoprotein carrier protein LolA [Desulfobulbaceae bacterium]
MKTQFTSFFLLILLSLTSFCQAGEWETISQNARQLKAVRAEFTQEKHLKILARPIISKGFFIYQAPGSLRWEYASPVKSLLLMHNGRSKKYIQRDDELVLEQGISLESMQIVLQEITHWLNGRFTDNPTFNAVDMPNLRAPLGQSMPEGRAKAQPEGKKSSSAVKTTFFKIRISLPETGESGRLK